MKMRRAFTLVEILTVTVIIGILATLVTLATNGALKAAKRARIGWEMNQAAIALDLYKAEFGEYPPDMLDDAALVRHVKKRWPRMELPSDDIVQNAAFIKGSINTAYGNQDFNTQVDFNAAGSQVGALALWLGGLPNTDGKLAGFSADPENPFFANPLVAVEERVFDNKSFIDGELGKSVQYVDYEGDGSFVPVLGNEIKNVFVPFVYFRGKTEGGTNAYKVPANTNDGTMEIKRLAADAFGLCVPYAESKNMENETMKWKNPTTYQLLHPGLDGLFGSDSLERQILPGTGIGTADLDNITSVSDYKELQSILP